MLHKWPLGKASVEYTAPQLTKLNDSKFVNRTFLKGCLFHPHCESDESAQDVHLPSLFSPSVVASSTNPSSNFQMVMEGINQGFVDYLMTFVDMTQEQRGRPLSKH